jgi:hypothetical protein
MIQFVLPNSGNPQKLHQAKVSSISNALEKNTNRLAVHCKIMNGNTDDQQSFIADTNAVAIVNPNKN